MSQFLQLLTFLNLVENGLGPYFWFFEPSVICPRKKKKEKKKKDLNLHDYRVIKIDY